jgi:hypothetical protein
MSYLKDFERLLKVWSWSFGVMECLSLKDPKMNLMKKRSGLCNLDHLASPGSSTHSLGFELTMSFFRTLSPDVREMG